MRDHQQNPSGFQPGDKVRLNSGPHKGVRGIICAELNGVLEVNLGSGDTAHVLPEEATNYSLAARRAWEAMPKRAGRPKGQNPVKRMVSMRLDADVLEMLREAVELGLVANREKAVNDWIREQASSLLSTEMPGELKTKSEVQSCQDLE